MIPVGFAINVWTENKISLLQTTFLHNAPVCDVKTQARLPKAMHWVVLHLARNIVLILQLQPKYTSGEVAVTANKSRSSLTSDGCFSCCIYWNSIQLVMRHCNWVGARSQMLWLKEIHQFILESKRMFKMTWCITGISCFPTLESKSADGTHLIAPTTLSTCLLTPTLQLK